MSAYRVTGVGVGVGELGGTSRGSKSVVLALLWVLQAQESLLQGSEPPHLEKEGVREGGRKEGGVEGREEEREKLPGILARGCGRRRQLTQTSRWATHPWDTLKYFDVPQILTEPTGGAQSTSRASSITNYSSVLSEKFPGVWGGTS